MRMQSRNRTSVGVALAVLLLLTAVVPGLAASPTIAQASPDNPVDLNQASANSLATVPGIGQVTAQRIVEWREAHGPFRRIEDLLKVKGIGDKRLEKLRPYLKVGKSR